MPSDFPQGLVDVLYILEGIPPSQPLSVQPKAQPEQG